MKEKIRKLKQELAFMYLYPPANSRLIEKKEKELEDAKNE